jgi:MFS family permease
VLWVPLAVLFGMATLPTYAIAAAHAYDHAEPGNYVETAAGILLANAAGSIIGPLLASALMQATGTGALFLFTAAAQGILALFTLNRLAQRSALKTEEKTEFDLSASAPVGPTIPPDPAPHDHVQPAAETTREEPVGFEDDLQESLPLEPAPKPAPAGGLRTPIPGPVGLRGNKV